MIRSLAPYLKRYKKLLLVGFALVVFKNFFQSMGPQIVREAIDHLKDAAVSDSWYSALVRWVHDGWGIELVFVFIGLYVSIEIFHGIFLYAMRQTLIVASRKIEYDLRNDFFAHLQKLHLQFFQYTRTGDLMSRMINDLSAVRDVLGPGIMYTANTIIAFVYVVPMMIHISPKLTLLAFVPLLVLSFAINQLSKLIHHRSQKVQEKLSDISSCAQENFSGIRVIKSFVREDHEIEKFRLLNSDYIRLNMDAVRVRGIMMSSVVLTIGLSVAILLWQGGRLVMMGDITLGQFTAFNFYLAVLIWPMIALGWVINIFQRGSASMKRMNEIFETAPRIVDAPSAKPIQTIEGKIEIRNLTFHYNGSEPVLKNINVNIHAGMTLGIVGHTGSGKSTLVNLIPRLYEIPKNTIFIDDVEIHDIPIDILRRHIGMVPQDTFLFSDTILNNILFGVEHTDTNKAVWAADVAQLKSNVEDFPEKYDTVIGERGITLSGGQKQRLAIARAVIREPKILILDDALSSVDTHTEDEILTRLKVLMENRTTLLVSHRIQTVKQADWIILLSEGAIIEQGTHEQLVALDGIYADMYQRQLLEEEIAEI
ncbi:ABC transporter ATP-binding protein/permease [bacterium]|nr:ABC transporter ATP-binding protein/permease [bacterium]